MAQVSTIGDMAVGGEAALNTYLRYARPDHLQPAWQRASVCAWPYLANVVVAPRAAGRTVSTTCTTICRCRQNARRLARAPGWINLTNMSRHLRYYRTAVNRRRLPFADVGSHARFDI